jgi:hypothetical protein
MRKLIIFVLVCSVAVVVGMMLLITPPAQVIVDEIIKPADDPIKAHYREFLAAKARWEANPVPHYRLHIVIGRGNETYQCEQVVEVEYEIPLRILRDTCTMVRPVLSVTDIFSEAERQIPSEIQWMNGYGCYVWVSHSEFDPIWNFPRRVEVTMDWATDQNIGEYKYTWVQRTTSIGHPCKLLGIWKIPVDVISFTPLP